MGRGQGDALDGFILQAHRRAIGGLAGGAGEHQSGRPDQPTLYVDFSGDLQLRDRVHSHFGDQLRYRCFAGSAQSTNETQLTAIQGPAPLLFFAPIQIRKRNAEWGPERVSSHIGEGLLRFYGQVTNPAAPLLKVVVRADFPAAQRLIEGLVRGKVSPNEGHIIRL